MEQHMEPDMKQHNRLVLNWERSVSRLYTVTLFFFNWNAEYIIQNSRLDEAQVGIKISWNQDFLRYADDNTLMAESKEELKEPLDEG